VPRAGGRRLATPGHVNSAYFTSAELATASLAIANPASAIPCHTTAPASSLSPSPYAAAANNATSFSNIPARRERHADGSAHAITAANASPSESERPTLARDAVWGVNDLFGVVAHQRGHHELC
jgi:hypothetical protein